MSPNAQRPATRRGDSGVAGYTGLLIVYVVGGYFLQSVLLNWLVGPFFLLIGLYVIPMSMRAIWRRLRAGADR